MRMYCLVRILVAAVLALAAGNLYAQSITWRIPTYGVEPAVAGIAKQSLAFDDQDNLYAFEYVAYTDGAAARLKHYLSATGALEWLRDIPISIYVANGWEIGFDVAGAALVSLGDDVVVVSNAPDVAGGGRIARYRASDGGLMWAAADSMAQAEYYAVTVDPSGDVIASGGTPASIGWYGHVAKFDGSSGTPRWSVDLTEASCASGPAYLLLNSVAADGNGDVVVAGALYYGNSGVAACVIKLRGTDGGVVWAHGYQPAVGESFVFGASMQLDAAGNAALGFTYDSLPNNNTVFGVVTFAATDGATLWANDVVKLNGQDAPYAQLTLDALGDVVVSNFGHTQVFDAADGHRHWANDAPVGGSIVVDPSAGGILVAHDDANGADTSGRHYSYFDLNPVDGAVRWESDLPVNTMAYWDVPHLIAADHAGHFAALQTESHICCIDSQALLVLASVTDGSVSWRVSDRDIGPSNASIQIDDSVSRNRSSVLTGDGGVVTSGVTYRWDDYQSFTSRILTKSARCGTGT